MKKKLVFGSMLAALLVLSLTMIGCKTDSNDDDNGGGGKVPTALQGNWLRDSDGTERNLRFSNSRWGTSSSGTPKDNELNWVVTSFTETKIEYQHEWYPNFDYQGSFNWKVEGTTLTISGGDFYLSDGTYTKQ